MILPVDFYRRPTLDVARDLIGKVLVYRAKSGTTAGAIVACAMNQSAWM